MWIYEQATGRLFRDGRVAGVGYSGLAEAKNQPDLDSIHGRGPIPRGVYRIGPTIEHLPQHPALHGPILPLAMIHGESHGRSGFLIHGDNADHTASHGCIVLDYVVRLAMIHAGGRDLEVVPVVAPEAVV